MKNAELLPAQSRTSTSKATPKQASQTNPYKMSTWTPKSKPANESMFADRRELVKKWFTNWSDKQKKAVLKDLLDITDVNFKQHIFESVKERHPYPEGIDFTKILKNDLSVKIFSYLSPKDLSNCSLVSHHWKNISEDDRIWYYHCKKNNWNLQKPGNKYERATWKRLYSSMMFQTYQAAQYFQPNGFNMTQDQMMLLNNRFSAQNLGAMQNTQMVLNQQMQGQNQTFPNNGRPTNMANNALTHSGMVANSSNYALLHQLNQQMTPRNDFTMNPQTFPPGMGGFRPDTAQTSSSTLSPNQTLRPSTGASSRQSRSSRATNAEKFKNQKERLNQTNTLSDRPTSSRASSITRKGRVKTADLENRPAWRANDKKPIDTRRKNYDLNDSFINSRPPSRSSVVSGKEIQSKVDCFRPGSRSGSLRRKKKDSGSNQGQNQGQNHPEVLSVHSPEVPNVNTNMNMTLPPPGPNFTQQQMMQNMQFMNQMGNMNWVRVIYLSKS